MAKQVSEQQSPSETQRLDKWLWYARVTKTRTLATTLVQSGKVRVNRQKTDKPGFTVKVDDVVTVAVHGRVRVLKVRAAGIRRGPAREAAGLFEEIDALGGRSDRDGSDRGADPARAAGGARPTKKERREIVRIKRQEID